MMNGTKIRKLQILKTVLVALLLQVTVMSFALASSQSQPTTNADFIDSCTGKKTAVAMPGGTKIRVHIKGLIPGFSLTGKIKVTPAYTGLEEKQGIKKLKGKIRSIDISSVDSTGEFSDEYSVKFPKQKNDLVTSASKEGYWNVRVEWTQGSGAFTSGSAFSTVYVPQSENQRFYRILGPTECIWETPPSITSQYYFNDQDVSINLSQEYTVSDVSELSKGVDFGVVPDSAGDGVATSYTPLLLEQSLSFGWAFSGFRTAKSLTEYTSMSQSWSIGKNQGGYYVKRLSFKRVPAEEYYLDNSGECSEWRVSYRGELDIGLPAQDFIVVPQSMAYDPKDAQQFMEKMRPTINTCQKIKSTMQLSNARLPGGGDDLIMFFFPAIKGPKKVKGE